MAVGEGAEKCFLAFLFQLHQVLLAYESRWKRACHKQEAGGEGGCPSLQPSGWAWGNWGL